VAIGIQEKYAAHNSHTAFHQAFSCWIFAPDGRLLVTRRALSKKAWPGVWTNSVCGHPQQGETLEQALRRRCRYEVGAELTDLTPVLPEFRYRETDPSGIVENERCPVYAARLTHSLALNHDEVLESSWVTPEAIFAALDATPWAFSPWMVLQARSPQMRERLTRFAEHIP
jgi:isopentenyl-diphosphate delta-isomerase